MPIVGPDFFNTSVGGSWQGGSGTSAVQWTNPQNVEGAPDGHNATALATSFQAGGYLVCYTWLGSVPRGYFWDFANFLIEGYTPVQFTGTTHFRTFIVCADSNGNFVDGSNKPLIFWGTPSTAIAVGNSSGVPQWRTISNSDWNFSGFGQLPTDIPVGVAIDLTDTPIPSQQFDSIRMTVSYNSNDNYWTPPYAISRNKRTFIAKRNKQEKIVFQQMRPRMLRKLQRRKAA